MESWSPSQSEPLTESYMCQRQSSSPMLPSAAAVAPFAAPGCGGGGNNLGVEGGAQAVFAAAAHGAQAGAAGADHHHVVGVILDRISAAVDGGRGAFSV